MAKGKWNDPDIVIYIQQCRKYEALRKKELQSAQRMVRRIQRALDEGDVPIETIMKWVNYVNKKVQRC